MRSPREPVKSKHGGIATRSFERRFALADHIQVRNADLKDGLLSVELVREIPRGHEAEEDWHRQLQRAIGDRRRQPSAGVEAGQRRRGAGRVRPYAAEPRTRFRGSQPMPRQADRQKRMSAFHPFASLAARPLTTLCGHSKMPSNTAGFGRKRTVRVQAPSARSRRFLRTVADDSLRCAGDPLQLLAL